MRHMSTGALREQKPYATAVAEQCVTDIDEARSLGTDLYHAHDLDVLGDRTRFALRLEAVRVGALTVGWLSYDTEVRVEAAAPESAYQVNVACTGSVLTWSGEDRMVAAPLRAAVYRADRAHALQWDRPCRTFGLRIERDFLDRQLEVLLGHRVRSPIAFDLPLDLSGGRGYHWWALVQALAGQLHDPDCPPPHPTLAASLEHSIARGLLLAAGHDYRAELEAPVTPARPMAVRKAVDYIESRPELPLTVGDIADAAGVGVRVLQEGFRASLGTTPMSYLRQVRLARVRHELLEPGDAAEGVAEVAFRWGFTHLGRFAAQYAELYGETPSQTLRG